MSVESPGSWRVLFVCMGNICRSPMAEGALRKRVTERAGEVSIAVDSAGTHGYHVGSPPDPRAQTAAARRGFDISALAARRVSSEDFDRYDYVLAMDSENLEFLQQIYTSSQPAKVALFLDYAADGVGPDVPDPYYGGPAGFERVLDLIEEATEGLLDELLRETRQSV